MQVEVPVMHAQKATRAATWSRRAVVAACFVFARARIRLRSRQLRVPNADLERSNFPPDRHTLKNPLPFGASSHVRSHGQIHVPFLKRL